MAPSALGELAPTRHREKRAGSAPAKKKNSAVSLLLAGLIALLLTAGLVRMFAKPPAPNTVMVVAAAKDLPPGYRIGFRDLHFLNVPKSYYTPEMATSYADLVGSYTANYLAMGEPICSSALLPGKKSLSDQLGTTERAFTLKLNEEALVDHTIVPGDHVDVLTTTTAKNGSKYTKTVCQNVLVLLSVPRQMMMSDKLRSSDPNKLTIAVTPESVEKLTQASEVGKVRVVLRNRTNGIAKTLPGADDTDLLPASATAVAPAIAPPLSKLWSGASANATKPTVVPLTVEKALPLPPPMPPVLNWMVEVFQGSKKESHAFPAQF